MTTSQATYAFSTAYEFMRLMMFVLSWNLHVIMWDNPIDVYVRKQYNLTRKKEVNNINLISLREDRVKANHLLRSLLLPFFF